MKPARRSVKARRGPLVPEVDANAGRGTLDKGML